MYDSIPNELKRIKCWVCWSNDKLPKNPMTGGNAQTTNPQTWGTFAQAVAAVDRYAFGGIGFVFDGKHGYFGVDLDHCTDDADFVDEFVDGLQSYNEYSRSGNGIHIICKGTLPEGARRKNNVEMYSEGRYFIMTGRQYNTEYSEIADCTETIKPLRAKYLPTLKPAAAPKEFVKLELSDEDVINKARACKTGNLFQLLYSGNWEGLYNSQSEADMALCNTLAFWCQKDKEQMDRIFRSSGLMRDKWERSQSGTTYGNITLEKAIAGCETVYEPKIALDDTSIALRFFGNGSNGGEVISRPKNNYDMTDTGNAQRFRDKYKGYIKYCYNRKKWYYWTGKKWQIDDVGAIKALADNVITDLKKEAFSSEDEDVQKEKLRFANRTANTNGKNAMITEAQHLESVPVQTIEFDGYENYLNCQNGIVNLRNGEIMPHEPELMMTKICVAECDAENKKPERWLKFLDEVTGGDKELQRYLQKCVGYSLTGSTVEQCIFFLYGMGNNGKSTFLETISNLLGDYAANAQPDTLMMRKDSGIGSDIARLSGTRFVTSEEPTEGVRLNEGLIKQLTGGGKITCRFLFGDEFEYAPTYKAWVATNHKPIIRGTDTGIWRRIRLIPFTYCVPKEKIDKTLKYKLATEMPQILRWAIDGCIMWQKEGLGLPKAVEDATAEYKSEMDLISVFVDNCITITNNAEQTIGATELYSLYRRWAQQNNEYDMSARKFGAEITKRLPDKKRTGGGIVYVGAIVNSSASDYGYTANMFE